MTERCPTCQQPMPGQMARILYDMRFTPQQRKIAELLDANFGRWVGQLDIVGFVGMRSKDPSQGIKVQICKMRRVIAKSGKPLLIQTDSFRGGRGYRLILSEISDGQS